MPGIDAALAEFADFNRRAARDMARHCSGPGCVENDLGLALRPGAAVHDLVTGQNGVILAGTIENSLNPAPNRDDS